MQWNYTFIRMTGTSNTIIILKPSSLGHVVEKLEKCQSQKKDIILSKFTEFYPKIYQVIYFPAQNSMQIPKP